MKGIPLKALAIVILPTVAPAATMGLYGGSTGARLPHPPPQLETPMLARQPPPARTRRQPIAQRRRARVTPAANRTIDKGTSLDTCSITGLLM
jgi:hypothetical protein